ncbi:serine hydrolase domain-containing protein [Actinoplanes flavus]|uniref:Beta-lactamase family protein n=1 Tax=Actinoplanes flavus TaxID=2820290 RepID=A0ABS3URG9_9ACTN|nr:serine hydrolase domain-containing protein [Actinoplanes flavus]MBO3741366.1 beta-lactamase family protein [Actinoplanes flavus]
MTLSWDVLRDGIDRIAPEVLATTSTPGALISIGMTGRSPLTLAYGVADVETGAPVTASHTMRVGSLGKVVVATAIAALVRSGDLDLDDPIDKHLPFPVVNPKGGTITLTKALAMLTGAVTDGYDWVERPEPAMRYIERELERGVVHEYGTGAPRFVTSADDAGWSSSSFMYQVAALTAEAVTGMPLGRYAQEEILDPLGLRDTAWLDSPHWDDVRSRCTRGHMVFGDRAVPLPWHECGTYHSVGAVTTPADFTTLMLALTGPDGHFRGEVAQTVLQPRTAGRNGTRVGFGVRLAGTPGAADHCVSSVGHYAFGWWAVSLAYPHAAEPFCVTVCTNLADQRDVFNPPEQYSFGILAYEIANWILSGAVDVRSLATHAASSSYVMGLVAADRFAGLMGAHLDEHQVAELARGSRPIGRPSVAEFDESRFAEGFLDMQAAVRDGRIDEFLAGQCPVGGLFRKLTRKQWGAKNFEDPAPVRFWMDRRP